MAALTVQSLEKTFAQETVAQSSKRPGLVAQWLIVEGKLVCKWIVTED